MPELKGNRAPVRVQRSRVTKQISPNGLPIVYAGRPSVYGNPFRVGELHDGSLLDAPRAVELFRIYFYQNRALMELARKNLSDKNLSCWCRLSALCHVDIILEFLSAERKAIVTN